MASGHDDAGEKSNVIVHTSSSPLSLNAEGEKASLLDKNWSSSVLNWTTYTHNTYVVRQFPTSPRQQTTRHFEELSHGAKYFLNLENQTLEIPSRREKTTSAFYTASVELIFRP